MYGQWNCESNMYRVTIVILPPIAMLNHFLNQLFITALTGTPVSIIQCVIFCELSIKVRIIIGN
jgi:hypothetical protein